MENTSTGPHGPLSPEGATMMWGDTDQPTDTEPSAETPEPRPRRRAMWITIAVVAISAASIGTYLTAQAVQHSQAVDEFNTTIGDRADAYDAQDKAIEQLHAAQDAAAA